MQWLTSSGPWGRVMSVCASLRVGLAAASGGLLALAFPGTGDQGWLAFGAVVPLVLAIDGLSAGRAALLSSVRASAEAIMSLEWGSRQSAGTPATGSAAHR